MEITKTDIMKVVEESCTEVFIEMKDDAKKIVTEEIIPAVAAAKNTFIDGLKKESETASSDVKLRNGVIIVAIKFTSIIVSKIFDKIFADTESIASETQPVNDATVAETTAPVQP